MVELGIIGLGKWGEVLVRAAQKSSRLRIRQGFSRSAETRQKFSSTMGIACPDDVSVLLQDPAIQGVILTVPNELHLPYALLCAQAGKHVYIEKPITNTLAEARELQTACAAQGVGVFIGHCAKLLAGVQQIRQAINRGDLGEICLIEGRFSNDRALKLTPNDWRWYQAKAPGGPLSQIAIHQFDVLRYLGGSVESLCAMSGKKSPAKPEVEDQWVISLRFANGALGCVTSSWTSPGVFEVRVVGTRGLMHYQIDQTLWGSAHLLHQGASLYSQQIGESPAAARQWPLEATDMFQQELELFADLVEGRMQPDFDARYGIEVLGMVEAARHSDHQGGVSVRLPAFLAASAQALGAA